ncbi:GNAT family N-acetyltransferase [Halopseudomonas salegens]|uniref:Ribosomal protein S18 acetylase RimI n=1 Tax=Halopseudomonas salegens TaxID=1434072 RepID=A0A1H2EP98_9GAMM|nr:GNAT family N-acetyltransferase [Halopseudomonas salegens]SDT96921.1 Ribosomal protein S18 acetylase RimI [Halopseudomonas salegens]
MALAVNNTPGALELINESDADRSFLERLYASTRKEELAPVPWPDAQKAEFLRTQFEAQDLHYRSHYSDTLRQLIRIDGALAGRLYVQRREHELRIVDIALLPEYRGRGIGALLLGQVLEEARAASKAVRIHVEKNNPAYRLYQRLGFNKLEEKGVYDLLEWRESTPPT